MKVRELIEALSKKDPGADVSIEGCDCINLAMAVDEELLSDGRVLIRADLS